jgi:DNA polymerase-1
VDTAALGALAAALQGEAEAAEAQATALLGAVREGTTGGRSLVGGSEINLRSQPQLLAALRALGLPVESTREEVLRPLAAQHPAVAALLAYRRGEHLGRLALGLAAALHPVTGRIHADWHQLVRNGTGRFSCSEPNLQNVPHDPRFRRAFGAPEGRALVIADLSQIELRVMAALSGDRRMIAAFQQGEDLHRLTAGLLAGVPPEAVTKEQRQLAKACNFGLIYGMSARGLQAYASSSYGVAMHHKLALEFRRRFFEAYPGIAAYHSDQNRRARAEREVRTLSGRCRRWETNAMPLPELLNAPCQGTGADILKAAMVALRPVLLRTHSDLVLAVHDELVIECPAERAEEVREAVRDALVRAGSDLLQPVPEEAEAVIGQTWADKG